MSEAPLRQRTESDQQHNQSFIWVQYDFNAKIANFLFLTVMIHDLDLVSVSGEGIWVPDVN